MIFRGGGCGGGVMSRKCLFATLPKKKRLINVGCFALLGLVLADPALLINCLALRLAFVRCTYARARAFVYFYTIQSIF